MNSIASGLQKPTYGVGTVSERNKQDQTSIKAEVVNQAADSTSSLHLHLIQPHPLFGSLSALGHTEMALEETAHWLLCLLFHTNLLQGRDTHTRVRML